MSSSSGIQHRGSLDQYSHSTCSTVNDPTCYFDKESNQVRKWDEQTLHSADAQRTVQNETDVNEESLAPAIQTADTVTDAADRRSQLPAYVSRLAATPQEQDAVVCAPEQWQSPWERQHRPVRNYSGDLSHVWKHP
eukprot:m.139294 g.139294  ORF g.139294 m.139294 type:complete len:136 (-) comp17617_c0_seq2:763-1170(-)